MPVKANERVWIDDDGMVHLATRRTTPFWTANGRVESVASGFWTVDCGRADTSGRLANNKAPTCLWCAARA